MQLGAVAFRGTARFRLVRFLGQGGMGLVYEAFDEASASPVALKLLPFVSPESLSRFKREFRAIADVHHPNLVRLHELVAEGAQWFFTMELVHGIDLLSYVCGENVKSAPTSTGPVPLAGAVTVPSGGGARRPRATPLVFREDRLRGTIAPLAEALAALHAAGCVHRDVKPTNVLVTAEGRPVLLDFGLASRSDGESTLAGAGTPEYMAPEQIVEASVGAAADWYAFGTILFEMLTGRLPFEGPRHEILYRKTRERPPRVSELNPQAPAELAVLADGLLALDPAARLGAGDVLACLVSTGAEAPRSRGSAPPPAVVVELGRAQFVGRDAELAALEAALAEVRAGAGARAVVVRGESGVGKSTLVRAFLDAQGEGALALAGRCYERELVPFKAVDGLVDALAGALRKREDAFVADLLPPRAAILLAAFPVLGRVDALARARALPDGMDAREVRASMFAAFRELMRRLSEERPIVGAIDDLQWADADSLALLAELLRGPGAPRLLLVGTVRTLGQADTGEARLFGPDAAERHLTLGNLEAPAARALALDLLSATARARASALADLVARESAGHPLFLRELARTVHLRTHEGAPLTLDGVLRARLEALSPIAQGALRALAIAGAPTPVRALASVVAGEGRAAALKGAGAAEARGVAGAPESSPGVAAGTGAALLSELRAARLVHSTSGRVDDLVDIAHDRVRQVARATISPDEARELHARFAATFEFGIDPLRAAGHWREAGQPARAAQRFADAAARAAEALAFDRAVALFETALELGEWTDERRRDLEVGLADALANAGRGEASARHYLAAARGAGPGVGIELRRRGTEELIRSGRLDEGRVVAVEALADAGLRFARAPLRALLGQRALLRLRGRRFRRRSVEEIAPRDLQRVDLCWSLSSGLGLMDPVQGAHFQVRSLLLALRAGDPYRVARGIAGEAAYAAAQGQAARSRALLDEAARIVADLGNPHATGIVSLMSGLAGHLLGRFGEGIAHLDAASRVFREQCVGTVWELGAARQFSLECLYYLGELPRFRAEAAGGLREAVDRGSVYATTTMRTGIANAAWLLDDDAARARDEVAAAKGGWSSRGYHIQHWYTLCAETQLALYGGDGAAAHALMEAGWPVLRRSHLLMIEHTRLVALHLRARAALAAAAAGAASELAVAREAGRRLSRSRSGWSRVFAALVEGGVASLSGDHALVAAAYARAAASARAEGLALVATAADLAVADLAADAPARDAALRWMGERGAKNARALARMLIPSVSPAG
jgi:hypothetical protein